jgi:WD40 repeat protein
LYDLQSKQIIDTIVSKKKSSGSALPTLIDVSYDDLFSIEASEQSIVLRNLRTNMALARFEGHQHSITSLAFAPNSYLFVSAANSECLIWNPRDFIKSSISTDIAEVSQPDKILDLANSDLITAVTLKEVGDGSSTFMAAVSTTQQTSIFYAKSGGKASVNGKNKVIKKDSLVRVQGQSE